MLPTNRRVKKDFFTKIMKNGVYLYGENFYLRYLDRKDEKPSLFSIVVSSKVQKTSVGRHASKRKISSVIEEGYLKSKPGFSVIIFCKKEVTAIPHKEVKREIFELLSKSGMLNKVEF